MKTPIALLLALSIMSTGAGCSFSRLGEEVGVAPMPVMTITPESRGAVATLASVGDIVVNQELFSPGKITMAFKIFGNDGKFYKEEDLKVVHEQKIHVILVRRDLAVFRHEHPVYQKNGYWTLTTEIKEPGDYMAYLDLSPVRDPAHVWRLPFRVKGTWEEKAPQPTPDLTIAQKDLTAKLEASKIFKTGEPTRIRVAITNKDGKAYQDFTPYLGAYGHLVGLRYQAQEVYLHTHPVTSEKPKDGTVEFETIFPERGRYTLFTQVNASGTIMTFPFTVDVTEQGITVGDHGQVHLEDVQVDHAAMGH